MDTIPSRVSVPLPLLPELHHQLQAVVGTQQLAPSSSSRSQTCIINPLRCRSGNERSSKSLQSRFFKKNFLAISTFSSSPRCRRQSQQLHGEKSLHIWKSAHLEIAGWIKKAPRCLYIGANQGNGVQSVAKIIINQQVKNIVTQEMKKPPKKKRFS